MPNNATKTTTGVRSKAGPEDIPSVRPHDGRVQRAYTWWKRTARKPRGPVVSRTVRLPLALDTRVKAEAEDNGYPTSRFLVVLAELGLREWQRHLNEGTSAVAPEPLVESITTRSWRSRVHANLLAEGQRIEAQRIQRLPTPTEKDILRALGEK
jgi:hypothetical protein